MTRRQYEVLSDLYNEYHEAFKALPGSIQSAWYDILYCRTNPTDEGE